MITNSQEYQDFLANIAIDDHGMYNPPNVLIRIPTDEKVYEIDWESRSIEAPESIGVETDHEAERIFFRMDRFVDSMDLSNCLGLIQFKNARREEYYQLISDYDTLSEPGKIIFAWDIQSPITKYSGTVTFSVKFFKINPASGELLYEINTLIASSKVLAGWANGNTQHDYITADKVIVNDSSIQVLLTKLQSASDKYAAVWWYDVD